MGRAISKLVRDVEIKMFASMPGAQAEEMPVQVHREWAVMGIWHRILAINIAGAHVPAVVEIPRHTELEHPTWLPIQHHRRVCPHGARGVDHVDVIGSEAAPI